MLRYTPLLAVTALSAPTCEEPGDKNVENGMSWYSCGLDDNAWYGVSLGTTFDRDYAVQSCNSFEGGELISIRNEEIDQCAYYSMGLMGDKLKTNVWQSLFYSSPQDKYLYCINGTDVLLGECYGDDVGYTNWSDEGYNGNNCATSSLSGAGFTDGYSWEKESCEARHQFMCRVDCGKLPTPEPTLPPVTETTPSPTTVSVLPPWERQIDVVVVDGDFGEWQDSQKMCQYNGYVCGITTRYQNLKDPGEDNTAFNGITIECCDWEDKDDNFPQIKVISNGFEGDFIRNFNCGKYKFMCGLRARYAAKGTYSDETGLNGIEVDCCDKYIWASHQTIVVNEGDFGEWQDNETKCPQNYYVCGMSLREQPKETGFNSDNTAANGIKVSCCAKP